MRTNIILVTFLGLIGIILTLAPPNMLNVLPPIVVASGIFIITTVALVRILRKKTHGANIIKKDISIEPIAFTAHQLRSPLSIIKGYSDLITDGTYGKTSNGILEAASKINLSADRALKTIDEILDFNLLKEGGMAHNPETIALNDFIKNNLNEFMSAITAKKLSTSFTKAPEGPKICVDKMHLHYIFDNLLDNALKYTERGKIEVSIILNSDGKCAMLSVSDTGIGIPAELIDKIFIPFERGSNKTRETKGIGLGLTIVKKMVEINGGKVWAKSEGEGKGATFYVEFPIIPK